MELIVFLLDKLTPIIIKKIKKYKEEQTNKKYMMEQKKEIEKLYWICQKITAEIMLDEVK